MSLTAVAQPHPIDHVRAEAFEGSVANVNGVESAALESPPLEAAHFGMFNDEIQGHMANLQTCLSTIKSPISGLEETFKRYNGVVNEVARNYGRYTEMEREIKILENQRDGFNRVQRIDFEQHAAEKEELKESHRQEIKGLRRNNSQEKKDLERSHAEQLSSLEERAQAGEKEKKKFQDLRERLEAQHAADRRQMEREVEQRKTELERASAETIAKLEKERTAVENEKARLEAELDKKSSECEGEKTMHKRFKERAASLTQTLDSITAPYELENRDSEIYEKECKKLVEGVKRIARSHFTDLPEDALEDPSRASKALGNGLSTLFKRALFSRVPIAKSQCSQILRLAIVQHVIFSVVFDPLWQPFVSVYLGNLERDPALLSDIYSHFTVEEKDIQQKWKVATMKGLKKMEDKTVLSSWMDKLIDGRVFGVLEPLLDHGHIDDFKSELKALLMDALELAKTSQLDKSPVILDMKPIQGRPGWEEWLEEDYEPGEMNDFSPSSPNSPKMPSSLEALCVSPRIVRRGSGGANTTGDAQEKIEVIQYGRALFPATGIFQDGEEEWNRIRRAPSEVARNSNGKQRRTSQQSVTGSSIMVRSPKEQDLSMQWGRRGVLD